MISLNVEKHRVFDMDGLIFNDTNGRFKLVFGAENPVVHYVYGSHSHLEELILEIGDPNVAIERIKS